MKTRTIEITVGLFIVLGVLALGFLAVQVSGLSMADSRKETYRLYAPFNNVAGLAVRAKVSFAGVTVGRVTAITIDPATYRATVEMAIDKKVNYLTTDSSAAIQTAGVLGEKYISLNTGSDPELLGDGDVIEDTQSALILEELIGKLVSSFINK